MTSPSAVDAAYRDVAALLASGRRFLITGHRNPDGDTLGSALGLALALEAAGKEARVVVRDTWGHPYAAMPGIERVVVSETLPPDWPDGYDALLAMECPEEARTGYAPIPRGVVVNVDHHPGNAAYGTVNLVDLPAAAVGEMIANLLDLLGWPITEPIATNLWVSLVSDTGSFRYGNTTPRALALGARLVAAGASPGLVNEQLFESVPESSLRLEALVLGTLERHADGAVATLLLPARFFVESGASPADTEGLVNRARGLQGVRAAALLKEAPEGIRCSLRSKGTVDVRSVAASFGGGGHRNASGCTVPGDLAAARARLVPELARAVAAEGKP